MVFKTKSEQETQELAQKVVHEALDKTERPIVFALYGELGAGKTTFTKAVAKTLAIEEEIKSPTFLLMRELDLPEPKAGISHLIHIDAYRIEDYRELSDLSFKKIVSDPKNFVVVEWAERVEELLPNSTVRISFEVAGELERKITITP